MKPRFQQLLRPAVAPLERAGITANQVTLTACVLSVGVGALLVLVPEPRLFLLIPLWLFLRMALNAADGMLARDFGQATPLGAYLNELCDVISDAALYLPFAFLPGSAPWLVGAVIVLSVISEMAGVLGVMVGSERRYDGPMGKGDRAFVFGTVGFAVGIGVQPGGFAAWVWAAMCVLLALTVVRRVVSGLRSAGQ